MTAIFSTSGSGRHGGPIPGMPVKNLLSDIYRRTNEAWRGVAWRGREWRDHAKYSGGEQR